MLSSYGDLLATENIKPDLLKLNIKTFAFDKEYLLNELELDNETIISKKE